MIFRRETFPGFSAELLISYCILRANKAVAYLLCCTIPMCTCTYAYITRTIWKCRMHYACIGQQIMENTTCTVEV